MTAAVQRSVRSVDRSVKLALITVSLCKGFNGDRRREEETRSYKSYERERVGQRRCRYGICDAMVEWRGWVNATKHGTMVASLCLRHLRVFPASWPTTVIVGRISRYMETVRREEKSIPVFSCWTFSANEQRLGKKKTSRLVGHKVGRSTKLPARRETNAHQSPCSNGLVALVFSKFKI